MTMVWLVNPGWIPIRSLSRLARNRLSQARACISKRHVGFSLARAQMAEGPLSKRLLQRDSINESVIAWLYLRRRKHQCLFREFPLNGFVAAEHLDRLYL